MKKTLSALIITIIFSAAGFLLRGHLLKNAYDASDLPVRGHPANTALIVLCVVFLCLLAAVIFTTRGTREPESAARLSALRLPGCVFCVIAGAAITVGGALLALGQSSRLSVILGVAAVAAGVCALLSAVFAKRLRFRRATGMLSYSVLFASFWLVCCFREFGGSDPVLQNYAYIILAVVCCVLGYYYIAGLAFAVPRPLPLVYFSMAATFFCAINLAEGFSVGLLLVFAGSLVYLCSFACGVLRNLGED